MKRMIAMTLCVMLLLCGCGGNGGKETTQAPQQGNTLTGVLDEVKDFMFIVTEDGGESYIFDIVDEAPEGLNQCAVGTKVVVTYTGELSKEDRFMGEVLSVMPAEG